MKRCSKCGVEKELTEFNKDKKNKDGYQNGCKTCLNKLKKEYYTNNKEYLNKKNKEWYCNNKEIVKIYNKEYRKNNKEKNKEYQKEWYNDNKENVKIRQKEWYKNNEQHVKQYRENNKERRRENNKEWCLKNKKQLQASRKEYNEKNKEYIKKRTNKYIKKILETNGDIKLKKNIRNLFSISLKNNLIKKTKSTFKYTEKPYADYAKHFGTNYPAEFAEITEKNKYHIDHIIPCAIYDFNNPEEIKKCWQPENLRLILAKENILKKDKIDYSLIEKHNIWHLLPEHLQKERKL